jgi:hypothetical protein
MEQDFSSYSVVLEKVAAERSMMAVTRLLASDLMKCSYMSVGDFIKGLSDSDVEMLLEVVESGDEDERFSELLLISQMLYAAEGIGVQMGDIDEATARVNAFIGFIVVESVARKGLAVAHHENMSFGEEMRNKIVVSRA